MNFTYFNGEDECKAIAARYVIVYKFKDKLFLELHTYFTPQSFIGNSINKNICKMLTKIYSPQMLDHMLAVKAIHSSPVWNDKFIQYESWDSTTFDAFNADLLDDENSIVDGSNPKGLFEK